MVQYDSWGQPAFLHRTMNKLSMNGEPWAVGLMTSPLQLSWIQYYLSPDSLGPTVGVPVTYAAPASAFMTTHIPSSAAEAAGEEDNSHTNGDETDMGCPQKAFRQYWTLRQQGIPLGPIPALDSACTSTLHAILGPLAAHYQAAQLTTHPELLAIGRSQVVAASSSRSGSRHYAYDPTEPPDPSPVAAWVFPVRDTDTGSRVARVLQVSGEALAWLKGQVVRFPVVQQNSSLSSSSTDSGLR